MPAAVRYSSSSASAKRSPVSLSLIHISLEFTGGTMVRTHFSKPIHVEDVRDRLTKAGIHNAQVQSVGGGSDVMIRLQPDAEHNNAADAAQKVSAQVLAAVNTPENAATVQPGEFVGPQVGRDLAMNGVYATLFMLVGFLIYIAARFEFKFAMVAIITAFFDLILTIAYMSMLSLIHI